ncbi:MAG: MFS transporter [Ginsengibacter sp.]
MNATAATKVRYTILAAVFANVVINYMDRSNISVAGIMISKELHLDSIEMGYVFSAFGWTYATLQIPGSILADRYGVRRLYTFTLIFWSLATIGLGFVTGFWGLILLRVLIGALEAPSYPMNNKIVTSWFPESERASAIGTYTSGQFIGLAFLTPALALIQQSAGWKGLFYITGFIGVLWGSAWYFLYRSPALHKKANEEELDYIEKGGGLLSRRKDGSEDIEKFKLKNLWIVLSQKKLWGIYIGQFCVVATATFFLTWFPKYLVEFRKMDFIKSGIFASIPFLCAFLGVLSSGFLSDHLVKRNVPVAVARKAPVIIGLFLAVCIMRANYETEPGWVVFYMSIAFFGNGLASITWIFVSLLAPKNLVGLTGGTFNFIGNLAGIVIPIVIGHLVYDGDFSPALVFIGCMAFAGALSYIFLVGKIERIIINN